MDMGNLIGLFAVIGVFSVPVFFFLAIAGIVAMSLVYAHRRRKMVHEQIKAALERGAPADEIERIAKALGANERRNDLLGGIAILAWGLGIGIFFLLYQQWGVAALVGLPMVIIGAAKIVYWGISGRKKEVSS
jgi:hypothetical protein